MDSHGDATRAPDAVARATAAATTLLNEAERAQGDLGAQPQAPTQDDATEEHLLFWLGASPYLVRLAELREVLPTVPPHVALPFSPAWLRGLFPLHTDLVALVDPSPILFDNAEAGQGDASRALVIGEDEHVLALLVREVGEICALRPEELHAPDLTTASGHPPLPQYIVGAYQIEALGRAAWALHIPRITEDLFSALEERPAYE
jgi:chemotaxis signal transduction protein